MPYMRRKGLTKMSRTTLKRRRTSVIKRARYQKPTARNQKSQIMGNAMAINSLRRLVPPPVYTDYQYCRGYGPFFGSDPTEFSSILCDKLMNLTQWLPVLRRDSNALESTTTLVKRMQLNIRYNLGQANWCQMTTFIVSLRRDAANRTPDDTATLVENDDFIVSTQEGFNARLNPAVFKVHYVRNLSLMSASWKELETTVQNQVFTSNSATTFAKGQVNMKLNFRIRQPTTPQNWKVMTQDQLSPHQRLYILTFFKGSTNEVDDTPPAVFYDALYTCYNSS